MSENSSPSQVISLVEEPVTPKKDKEGEGQGGASNKEGEGQGGASNIQEDASVGLSSHDNRTMDFTSDGDNIAVTSSAEAKIPVGSIVGRFVGGKVRTVDKMKEEEQEKANLAVPLNLSSNAQVVFEGALTSFEEAWKTALKNDKEVIPYQRLTLSVLKIEDLEKKLTVQVGKPICMLPNKQYLKISSKFGPSCVFTNAKVVPEFALQKRVFVPVGLAIVSTKVLQTGKGPVILQKQQK